MTPDGTAGTEYRERPALRVDRSNLRDERSIGDLIKELQSESSSLVRQEVELAKSEVAETARVYARNAAKLGIGGVLLVAALFGGLITINRALTAILAGMVGVDTAIWLAPLMLTVVLAIAGWTMLNGALERIRNQSLVPERTTTTLKEEKQWLKHRIGR